ncbi:MAG: glycosyltransferase family 2 protein [Deltaproteobacteria bacterium]|jgi:glycosyltransferase involved in cell wall biosynthesis|nr:glycosyltransferase family 2 protein [Deltaproteobacteria bacterium]
MSLVSVIIPLYNEEDNIQPLYKELCAVANKIQDNVEFILVDDGSKDHTVKVLKKITAGDSRVKLIKFRRNFGQTAAIAAGFDYADGEIIAVLDGDLQNDPAEIPRLIAKLNEGYDMVAGWRKDRKDAFLNRRLPSMIANKLISTITKVKLHDYGCSLKVMRSEVAKNLQLYGEMHRFIPALANEMGINICELAVNHRPRIHGQTKYGISRTFRVVLDLLTVKFFLGYFKRPSHAFGFTGLVSSLFGALLLAYLMVEKFIYDMSIGSRPLLILSVMLVIVGMQFLCFGLLAEILVRTYHESQNKKIYAVREVWIAGEGSNQSSSKVANI